MLQQSQICFRLWSDFSSRKLSANVDNTKYYYVSDPSTLYDGEPDIQYHSFVVIKDMEWAWTHGKLLKWVNVDSVSSDTVQSVKKVTDGTSGTAASLKAEIAKDEFGNDTETLYISFTPNALSTPTVIETEEKSVSHLTQ